MGGDRPLCMERGGPMPQNTTINNEQIPFPTQAGSKRGLDAISCWDNTPPGSKISLSHRPTFQRANSGGRTVPVSGELVSGSDLTKSQVKQPSLESILLQPEDPRDLHAFPTLPTGPDGKEILSSRGSPTMRLLRSATDPLMAGPARGLKDGTNHTEIRESCHEQFMSPGGKSAIPNPLNLIRSPSLVPVKSSRTCPAFERSGRGGGSIMRSWPQTLCRQDLAEAARRTKEQAAAAHWHERGGLGAAMEAYSMQRMNKQGTLIDGDVWDTPSPNAQTLGDIDVDRDYVMESPPTSPAPFPGSPAGPRSSLPSHPTLGLFDLPANYSPPTCYRRASHVKSEPLWAGDDSVCNRDSRRSLGSKITDCGSSGLNCGAGGRPAITAARDELEKRVLRHWAEVDHRMRCRVADGPERTTLSDSERQKRELYLERKRQSSIRSKERYLEVTTLRRKQIEELTRLLYRQRTMNDSSGRPTRRGVGGTTKLQEVLSLMSPGYEVPGSRSPVVFPQPGQDALIKQAAEVVLQGIECTAGVGGLSTVANGAPEASSTCDEDPGKYSDNISTAYLPPSPPPPSLSWVNGGFGEQGGRGGRAKGGGKRDEGRHVRGEEGTVLREMEGRREILEEGSQFSSDVEEIGGDDDKPCPGWETSDDEDPLTIVLSPSQVHDLCKLAQDSLDRHDLLVGQAIIKCLRVLLSNTEINIECEKGTGSHTGDTPCNANGGSTIQPQGPNSFFQAASLLPRQLPTGAEVDDLFSRDNLLDPGITVPLNKNLRIPAHVESAWQSPRYDSATGKIVVKHRPNLSTRPFVSKLTNLALAQHKKTLGGSYMHLERLLSLTLSEM